MDAQEIITKKQFLEGFSTRLIQLYREKGFATRDEFAAEIRRKGFKITKNYLAKYFKKDPTEPGAYNLAALAEGLDTTVDFLLFGRPDTTEDFIVEQTLIFADRIVNDGKEVKSRLADLLVDSTARIIKNEEKKHILTEKLKRMIKNAES